MNKLSHILLKNRSRLKKIGNWVLYGIFGAYILFLVVTTTTLLNKLIYSLIGLVVLAIILLFEWLTSLYEKMILALTYECNCEKSLVLRNKLIRFDCFKGFAPSLTLFDCLLLLDRGYYQECLAHLKKHQRFFHGTNDYLLINYRTKMQCAYFLKDWQLFDDSLKKLSQLKFSQSKKDLSPLYSWEEINGLKLFRDRRFSKSLKTLDGIVTQNFNSREQTYLLFERAQVNYALNKLPEAHGLLNRVIEQGNQLYLVELAKRKEWITFEKYQ